MTPINEESVGKPPEIWVVFDTDSIFSDSASSFLGWGAKRLIDENPDRVDLTIRWFLPEVVKLERTYQMVEQAKGFRADHRRMIRFLGEGSEVGSEEIEARAESLSEGEVEQFGLDVRSLDYTAIDWASVVQAATQRLPPFKPGETEEGFRDALISEGFFQIADVSPKDIRACRVVLVTVDKLLRRAVELRSDELRYLKVMSIEELKGLINSILSDVPEDLVQRLQELVSPFFYAPGDEGSLFVAQEIEARVNREYANILSAVPEGADSRDNGYWEVADARFVGRDGDIFSWRSQIAVRCFAYRRTSSSISTQLSTSPQPFSTGPGYFGVTGSYSTLGSQWPTVYGVQPPWLSTSGGQPYYPSPQFQFPSSPLPLRIRELVSTGTSVFEVAWSVEISNEEDISSPHVGEIIYVGTYWN